MFSTDKRKRAERKIDRGMWGRVKESGGGKYIIDGPVFRLDYLKCTLFAVHACYILHRLILYNIIRSSMGRDSVLICENVHTLPCVFTFSMYTSNLVDNCNTLM